MPVPLGSRKRNISSVARCIVLLFLTAVFLYRVFEAFYPFPWGTDRGEKLLLRMQLNGTSTSELVNYSAVVWTNSPTLLLGDDDKREVLTNLVESDRNDIIFWQGQLFTISFWVNSAILAIVAFVLRAEQKRSIVVVRFVSACACLCLGIVYLLFVSVAEKAMLANDHDLRGIQIALGLFKPSWYLSQPIYQAEDISIGQMGHFYIWELAALNIFLVICSYFLLVPFFGRNFALFSRARGKEGTNLPSNNVRAEMTEDDKTYLKALADSELQAIDQFDKTLLALAGGAFGVSFAFLKDIVRPDAVINKHLLFAAWILWSITLTGNLAAFYFSHLAMRRAQRMFCAGERVEAKLRGFTGSTVMWLNPITGVTFISGLICMSIFVTTNLRDAQPTSAKAAAPASAPAPIPVPAASAATAKASTTTR